MRGRNGRPKERTHGACLWRDLLLYPAHFPDIVKTLGLVPKGTGGEEAWFREFLLKGVKHLWRRALQMETIWRISP
jgi:hypothetical protein